MGSVIDINKFVIIIIDQNNELVESFGPFINKETANLWLDENENQFNGEDAVIVLCTGINQEVLDESVKGTAAAIVTALSALIGTYLMSKPSAPETSMQFGKSVPRWVTSGLSSKQATKPATEFKISSNLESPQALAPWEVDGHVPKTHLEKSKPKIKPKIQYNTIQKTIELVHGSMKEAVETIMARLNVDRDQAIRIVREIRSLSKNDPNKLKDAIELASKQLEGIADRAAIEETMKKFNMNQDQATKFIQNLRSLK